MVSEIMRNASTASMFCNSRALRPSLENALAVDSPSSLTPLSAFCIRLSARGTLPASTPTFLNACWRMTSLRPSAPVWPIMSESSPPASIALLAAAAIPAAAAVADKPIPANILLLAAPMEAKPLDMPEVAPSVLPFIRSMAALAPLMPDWNAAASSDRNAVSLAMTCWLVRIRCACGPG